MQYVTLGNTGLAVSRLGFGAMTFTQGDQSLASIFKVGAALADRLVGQSLDAGVNLFDTADSYASGQSEIMLGQALKSRRDEVVITTKTGFRSRSELLQAGLSRRHIIWSVEQSLKRLGTDWIDLLVVHKEDPFTPLEETLDALDTVVKHGKARYIGFSNWSAWKVAAAMEIQRANGLARFSHGQMNYSLLGRDVERDIVPMMKHYGIGMTVWSPLAAGFLTGKYTRENLSSPDTRLGGFDILPIDKEAGFLLVEKLRSMGAERGASVAQLAISWLLAKPGVDSVLLGATKSEQLADNLGAADVVLTAAEVATLDSLTPLLPVYPNWFNNQMGDQLLQAALGEK